MELWISVKLLTQQYAAPSAARVKIKKDELAFGFPFGQGVVKASLEPLLAGGRGDKNEHHGKDESDFSHVTLPA